MVVSGGSLMYVYFINATFIATPHPKSYPAANFLR